MLGSVGRYAVGGLVHRIGGGGFPYGTLVVNVVGCMVLGFLATISEERSLFQPATRLFLFVGILGGFTTFSTFGYESFSLLRDGVMNAAMANITANLLLGLAGVWLGHAVARMI